MNGKHFANNKNIPIKTKKKLTFLWSDIEIDVWYITLKVALTTFQTGFWMVSADEA